MAPERVAPSGAGQDRACHPVARGCGVAERLGVDPGRALETPASTGGVALGVFLCNLKAFSISEEEADYVREAYDSGGLAWAFPSTIGTR